MKITRMATPARHTPAIRRSKATASRAQSFKVQSFKVQTTATNKPIKGMYAYRSAIVCSPTVMIPIIGTRVPRNQNQPTGK